jgi:hypothetical protein
MAHESNLKKERKIDIQMKLYKQNWFKVKKMNEKRDAEANPKETQRQTEINEI